MLSAQIFHLDGGLVKLPRGFFPVVLTLSSGILSVRAKAFIHGFEAYTLYTGAIGFVVSGFVPVEVPAALEGIVGPIRRTLLESARMIAALTILMVVYTNVRTNRQFEAILRRIVARGFILC
jgi:hypothetical protein